MSAAAIKRHYKTLMIALQ